MSPAASDRETRPREATPGRLALTRVLDACTLAAVIVAVAVVVFGSLRLRMEPLSLSVQSPWRAVAVAVLLAAARHALVPRPHLAQRFTAAVRRWRRDPAVIESWRAFACVRVPVLVASLFAVLIAGYAGGERPPFRASENEVVNLPARWDAGWYLGIALDGYSYEPERAGQQNIAFFPAYPMLMRAGGALLGARHASGSPAELEQRLNGRTVLAGWIIALAATALALVYLHRFAQETLGGDAANSVWLISAYPFAYFFGAVYTEGLFLLGSVATLYHFRRHEHVQAGCWGLLVGLTRPNGCFLSVPLGIMALQQAYFPRTLKAGDPAARPGFTSFAKSTVAASMPGVGMLLFTAWLWWLTNVPFAWIRAHAAWGRTLKGLDGLILDRADAIGTLGVFGYMRQQPVEALYVAALLFTLAMVWPVARRLGIGYAALVLLTVLPPLSAGGFLSIGRITSTIFPVFVYLGWRLSPPAAMRLVAAWMALQGVLAALFFTWHQVY